jgi:hypothetical protein
MQIAARGAGHRREKVGQQINDVNRGMTLTF